MADTPRIPTGPRNMGSASRFPTGLQDGRIRAQGDLKRPKWGTGPPAMTRSRVDHGQLEPGSRVELADASAGISHGLRTRLVSFSSHSKGPAYRNSL